MTGETILFPYTCPGPSQRHTKTHTHAFSTPIITHRLSNPHIWRQVYSQWKCLLKLPLHAFCAQSETKRKDLGQGGGRKARKLWLGCPVVGLTHGPTCGTRGSRQAGWEEDSWRIAGIIQMLSSWKANIHSPMSSQQLGLGS